jgi:hypothetical protein
MHWTRAIAPLRRYGRHSLGLISARLGMSASVALLVSSCGGTQVRSPEAPDCAFPPEEAEVLVHCTDGSRFQAPVGGGAGHGIDARGQEVDVTVSFNDGRYRLEITP